MSFSPMFSLAPSDDESDAVEADVSNRLNPLFQHGSLDRRAEQEYNDGSDVDVQLTIPPSTNGASAGPPADASEQNALEAQLRQAQKMKTLGTLVGGLAHDFNNLLHSAKVYVQLSQEDLPEEHAAQNYLNQTLSGLQQAEELVNKLLTVSQPERATSRQRVEVAPLVQEMLDLIAPSLPEGLTLRTHLESACAVMGDPAQLQQVVMNLVTNAGQAMEGQWGERSAVLEVSVQRVSIDEILVEQGLAVEPGPYVHLAVSDTGAGMDRRSKERIFEPFFTTKEAGKGTGLGLSVVHSVVEAHGGSTMVRSEQGQGTTFNVYLPQAAEAEQPDVEIAEPEASPRTHHILVVDDEEAVRELEKIRLGRLGYDVTAMGNGREALEAVEADPEQFDVVLTDHRMPGMDGLELTRAVRQNGHAMPIVLVTGLGAQVSESEARIVGVSTFLQKPVGSSELQETLSELT